jgi:hypothetical protein
VKVTRPSTTADAVFTYDLTSWLSLSDMFRFVSYRIAGDVNTLIRNRLKSPNGTITTPSSIAFGDEFTGVSSYWNTFQANFSLGRKLSGNAGVRTTYRDVTLRHFINPKLTEIETETETTNTLVAGFRYRPVKKANFFFNYEKGNTDNAFVRVNPLDYQLIRVRTNIQPTEKLQINLTFTSTDRKNPTRFVENDFNARSISASVFWQPNARVWLTGGYDYDHLASTADIVFFSNSVMKTGRSIYYTRQNFAFTDARFAITKHLDALLSYRYTGDRGAPDDRKINTNDFISSLPLARHNPEFRLAYRFNDHITANVTYRHYSYNERDRFIQDYRANILTTSVRYTF